MRKFLPVLVLSLLLQTASFADDSAGASGLATREGLIYHVDTMAAIENPLGTSSDLALRFMPNVSANYFLTNRFGLALGLSYAARSFVIGSLSTSASFMDLQLGVVGRRIGDLFSDSSVTFYSVGPYLAIPFGDFTGSATLGFSNQSKPFYGLYVHSSTIYLIDDDFGLGPTVSIRMALADPVKNLTARIWFWDICVGLRATF